MKKEIVQQLIDHQQKELDEVMERIQTLNKSAAIDEDNTIDPDDLSHQDEYNEMSEYFNDERTMLENNLTQLKLALNRTNHTIVPGALVETNNNLYLVGPSFEGISFQGKGVLPLSTFTKVYSDNKEKKVGDVFELYDGKNENILSIH